MVSSSFSLGPTGRCGVECWARGSNDARVPRKKVTADTLAARACCDDVADGVACTCRDVSDDARHEARGCLHADRDAHCACVPWSGGRCVVSGQVVWHRRAFGKRARRGRTRDAFRNVSWPAVAFLVNSKRRLRGGLRRACLGAPARTHGGLDVIDQCTDAGRMMIALGALFFLLGLRFKLLQWREYSAAQTRLQAAVEDAKRELRRGVTVVQALDDSHELAERSLDLDEFQVVQAKSDPPSPLP